jgi:cobalamin biosynthesis Mg chelatase CobN
MRAFEIHIYQSGRWKIDSSFDDKNLAMHEARRMEESGRYSGIRVIEETFDEVTEQVSSRTIFRGTRVDQSNNEHLERAKTVRREATASRQQRQQTRTTERRRKTIQARKKKSSPVRLVVVLSILAAFAIGAMVGLQYLRAFL